MHTTLPARPKHRNACKPSAPSSTTSCRRCKKPSVIRFPASNIGREEEIKILRNALQSPEAELVAVIGRRRVGKTFLVRWFFKEDFAFEMTGTQGVDDPVQLSNFAARLKAVSGSALPLHFTRSGGLSRGQTYSFYKVSDCTVIHGDGWHSALSERDRRG